MSVKVFCDVCDEEIKTNRTGERLVGETCIGNTRVVVEVMAGAKKHPGGQHAQLDEGDLCTTCLVTALEAVRIGKRFVDLPTKVAAA